MPLDAHDPLEVACKSPLRPKEFPLVLWTERRLFLFVLPPFIEDDDMLDGRVLWWGFKADGPFPPVKYIII